MDINIRVIQRNLPSVVETNTSSSVPFIPVSEEINNPDVESFFPKSNETLNLLAAGN